MRPQFFPWLFDDKNAWEKAFADPRYSYEMPIDYFMAIYQVERKDATGAPSRYALPELSMPATSLPAATAFAPTMPAFFATSAPVVPAAAPPQEKSKSSEGILSQEEIDALLAGI